MSGLAEILLNLSYAVSGSDLQSSPITNRLENLGLTFYPAHDASNIENAEVIVVSAAVPETNPEIVCARENNIPILHRSEVLADLIRIKPHAVVVGGSHGKTTTTSIISTMLDVADIGATSIVGGVLHRSGTNAKWGTGDYIVAEADEHDGSFLRLHPTIALVTNIDAEHLEYYGTLDNIKRSFVEFCNGVPFFGYVIVCADDPNIQSILHDVHATTITYGLKKDVDVQAEGYSLLLANSDEDKLTPKFQTRVQLKINRDKFPESIDDTIFLNTIGENNIRNALGAYAVGLSLGLDTKSIKNGIEEFSGVQRRLQWVGEVNGVQVIEDYAHHPTEIESTIEAVRWLRPKRIIIVLQPHLYSRTKFFATEFAAALGKAELAYVTDIYPSREEPIPGIDSGIIIQAGVQQDIHTLHLLSNMDEVPETIAAKVDDGDIVLLLGAGNINRIGSDIIQSLESKT
jgi:UDP-N-acetylmuramate--alanine ligase